PDRIIPPPRIQGRVTAVRIEGEQVIQTFGRSSPEESESASGLPSPHAQNYMYFRGGMLPFGKLTMRDADLEIIDSHPADYLDFDLAQYNRQLVASHIRETSSFGLIVYMPDLYRIASQNPAGSKEEVPGR